MREKLKDAPLPFDVICDPEKQLYQKFQINPATGTGGLMDVKTVGTLARAMVAGYRHGEYEGEELQLPATFVVNRNMKLLYVHYGKSAADVPSGKVLQKWLDRDK